MKKIIAAVLAMTLCLCAFGALADHFVIATDTVFKPFEYTDAKGNFVGIDVDLLAAIAEDQGFTYDLNSLGWEAAIAACQADGTFDGYVVKAMELASGEIHEGLLEG